MKLVRIESAHRLAPGVHALIGLAGDYSFVTDDELACVRADAKALSHRKLAELLAKHIVADGASPGMGRLALSRQAAKAETLWQGPALHIIVPTLQCAHSCQYCQVSRSLDSHGFSLTPAQIDAACDTCLESPLGALTVEFQGGDPLIRFDLVKRAIDRISTRAKREERRIRFVVASTLHQLTPVMCAYFKEHGVVLSTSIDGPAELHNANRPLPTRDSYERTVDGIELARGLMGHGVVSALMTTSKAALSQPEAIVDEYVKLGFDEIFLRPLGRYGFAKRNERRLAYELADYKTFYVRCLERVLWWNAQGVRLREASAAIVLNKLLSPFDAGYVDLQTPTGAGTAILVYNYDGFVYPSDESRMLAEAGDISLRLGPIGTALVDLVKTPVVLALLRESTSQSVEGCNRCAFNVICGPDPVARRAQHGADWVPVEHTEHCRRTKWMFEMLLRRLHHADDAFLDVAHAWARQTHEEVRDPA